MPIDPERDRWNRETLARYNLDGVICRLPEDVLLLTGYWPLSSWAFTVYPREGEPVLLAVETERDAIPPDIGCRVELYKSGTLDAPDPYESVERLLRESIARMGLGRARIGIEQRFESVAAGHTAGEVFVPAGKTQATIAAAAPEAEIVDCTDALHAARIVKTPREIEALRRANDVATFGLEAFRELYEAGRREVEVAVGVEVAIVTRGMDHEGTAEVRAWAQLMTGPRSAMAYSLHPATSGRVIERGDLGVLELATMTDGYWSDLTRTLVAGEPSGRQEEMYATVVRATEAALLGARPGMTGSEIDGLARAVIQHAGYGDLFVHPTGHGLGFRYHEPKPILKPGSEDVVEEGMVTSIEPGLYMEGFGGMRLEENVVFTDSGPELLSHAPRNLSTSR